jgi:hypothetical protein
MSWNPWRWVGEHYPHIVVSCEHRLPKRVAGIWRDNTIWLCSTLNQAERRSVLTHELQHLQRGLPSPQYRDREERIVDELAARRLIAIADLARALRSTRDPDALAEELWVDRHTVEVRLSNLNPDETAELEHEFGDEWLWIP